MGAVRKEWDGESRYTPAFNLLYCKYSCQLMADVIRRYYETPEAVHEMSNLIWAKIWIEVPKFKVGSKVQPWLYRVAVNFIRNEMRKDEKHSEQVEITSDPRGAGTHMEVDDT